MTRYEIVLAVDAEEQADARDLADAILKATRVALLNGQHPGVQLDNHITVAQITPPPVRARVLLPHGPRPDAA